MAFVYSLCSSSKGNSTYIGTKRHGILVDAGISLRNFTLQMQQNAIEEDAIKAIFITHEHSDHIKGLLSISKKCRVPIYASRETLEELINKNCVPIDADLNEIDKRSCCVADLEVFAFTTPHDSAHSLGYEVKTHDDKKICICTDLGYVPDQVYERLSGSDFVLLESNYDETMLTFGKYPYFLKRRILGEQGHLSNELCGETLVRLLHDGTKNFLLGHLSENNNRPEIALNTAVEHLLEVSALRDKDYILSVAPVLGNGEVFAI